MKFLEIFNRMTMGRALLLGMVLAAFYYFLMFDGGTTQRTAIDTSKAQVAALQKEILDNQAKLDRAAVYKKTAAEIGTTINRLLGVIPEKFGISDLTKIVSNETRIAGSSLISITPGTPEISPVAKEFEELTVKLDMNGSFLQHMVFLSNLTKINQILIVRKFDLAMAGEAKGEESPNVHM
ncbi:MAG: type 4a pilus biogenesis protein PilO, partial [Bdellovibrionales bacterium]